jgi:diaminopimelate decarboxylase
LKPRALGDGLLRELAERHGTPLYVYDGATIVERLGELAGFDRVRYAQKACSNLAVLELVRRHGAAVDAVSAGEVLRALAAGFAPGEILFTADLFDRAALELVVERGVPVNLGSPDMIAQYGARAPGRPVVLRVNPGFGHGHARQVATGGEQSKHGIWHADLESALADCRARELPVVGLHVHIGSGSDYEHLARVARTVEELAPRCGPDLAMISAGGGLPVPYRPGEGRIDLGRYASTWIDARARLQRALGREIELEVEPGRWLVAESGVLLAEVRGVKRSGALDYVLVDAGFNDLVRPAMYGAYHEISLLPADGAPRPIAPRVVAGPLCESADVFTQGPGGAVEPRPLPAARAGDLVCVHDCGAYSASMSSNYNSRPHAAEVLLWRGEALLVRRRQRLDELFAHERGLGAAERAGGA